MSAAKSVRPRRKAPRPRARKATIGQAELAPYILLSVACDRVVPLPVLDDYVIGVVNGTMVHQIARSRGLDMDDEALSWLAWGELTDGAGALKALARHLTSPWAYLKEKFDFLSSGEEAAKCMGLGLLLDRYLASRKKRRFRLAEAKRLKELIDKAISRSASKFPRAIPRVIKEVGPKLFKEITGLIIQEAKNLRDKSRPAGADFFDRMGRLLVSSLGPLAEASAKVALILAEEGAAFAGLAEKSFDELRREASF